VVATSRGTSTFDRRVFVLVDQGPCIDPKWDAIQC
jgi:hypothetical protein